MTIQYDENKIGEFLDQFEGKDKENMREAINQMSEIINKPIEHTVKVMLNFKVSVEETCKQNKNWSVFAKGLTTSFAASTISNLMEVFNFTEEDMTNLMKDAFEHMRNTAENKNI